MTAGTYEELLPCTGKLRVRSQDWEIEYYFPGPDNRYNGTFVRIPGASISEYVTAFADNWREYTQLRVTIPAGGEFTKSGRCGMTIRIGGFRQGVCLRDYHMPIESETQLAKVISGYRYAADRAPQIQRFLATL